MKRHLFLLCGTVLAAALAGPAAAMGFAEAWDAAREHDAQYRAAAHELDATRQGVPIARASLLPSVNLNLSTSNVTGTREFPNALGQQVRVPANYNAPQASLSLRQSLFNYEANARLGQALAQSEGGEQVYRARGYDLADRLGVAYIGVLLALENLELTQSQVAMARAQAERAEQRLARGEGTRVEVALSQSVLDLARVRVIEARDQIAVARRDFLRVTGVELEALRPMASGAAPATLNPATLVAWVDLAQRQSAIVRIREQQLEAARFGVQRNRAGHMPRLDLVASVSNSRNESISSLDQKSVLSSIGVQFSLPLYSGGGVDASISQSMSEVSRAEEELRAQRETVALDIQRYYQGVMLGAERIEAHRRAVASAGVALTGAERALEAGVGTTSAVLEALAQVYVARRDFAQARYDYLLSRLRLLTQAGTPVPELIADIESHLSAAVPVPRPATP